MRCLFRLAVVVPLCATPLSSACTGSDGTKECVGAADCNRDGKQDGSCSTAGQCVYPQVQILEEVELADASRVAMALDARGRYLLPGATVGQAYQVQLMTSGGDGLYLWTHASGELVPNLSLSSSGLISGTPVHAASVCATLRVTSAHAAAEGEFCLTVEEASHQPKSWDELVWDFDVWG